MNSYIVDECDMVAAVKLYKMEQFKPPSVLVLEGNVSENWKRWKHRFDLYLKASGADKQSEDTRYPHDWVPNKIVLFYFSEYISKISMKIKHVLPLFCT